MKTTYTNILLLLLFTMLTAGCKKDPTKNAVLPAATQEGKNTVGFTLNGEVWVPYYKCGFGQDPCGEISARYGASGGASPNGIDFGFARIRNGKESSLIITSAFSTVTSVGEKTDSIGVILLSEHLNGNNGYFTGPLPGSKFMITRFDRINQIISGEFEFVLLEQNRSGRAITLKDGRFDFKFNACKCSN